MLLRNWMVVCGEACSDMCPHWVSLTHLRIWEGLRRLYLAIRTGRNPWKSQQKTPRRASVDDLFGGRLWTYALLRVSAALILSTMSKAVVRYCNSIQTTLSANPQTEHPNCYGKCLPQFDLIFTLNNNNITTHLKITRSRYFCTFFMTKSEVWCL